MTYGPDAVHELIEESGWSYPVSVRKLEGEHALANVQLDAKGRSIMLSELLLDADADTFENRDDLERKLEPVFEEEIESRQSGFLSRVKRSLLNGE